MQNILIFDIRTSGHHIEYINHLVRGAVNDTKNSYVFALKYSDKIYQPNQKNISFVFIDDIRISSCLNTNKLLGAYRKSKLLFEYVTKYKINKIFLIYLMEYIPFLFACPSNVKVSGIIYSIYLYFGSKPNSFSSLFNAGIYKMISIKRNFEPIFILNDSSSTAFLNRKFSTKKFFPLEDPFNASLGDDLKSELNVSSRSEINFLHFGCLCRRKGTMTILHAISLIPATDARKFKFVFAGKVDDDIKDEYYTLIKKLQPIYNIELHDRFCSESEIHHFCRTTDYILVPYSRTSASSGLIGYAAKYDKPVIGPSDGLLGKLIRKNSLGTTLKNVTPEALKESFYKKHKCDGRKYIAKNSIDNFLKTIFKSFE